MRQYPASASFQNFAQEREKMLEYWIHVSPLGTFLATIVWCLIGMPAMVAGLYQSWKARQEAKAAREGTLESKNAWSS